MGMLAACASGETGQPVFFTLELPAIGSPILCQKGSVYRKTKAFLLSAVLSHDGVFFSQCYSITTFVKLRIWRWSENHNKEKPLV